MVREEAEAEASVSLTEEATLTTMTEMILNLKGTKRLTRGVEAEEKAGKVSSLTITTTSGLMKLSRMTSVIRTSFMVLIQLIIDSRE